MSHKVLIIGFGSSGQRYFEIIKKNYPHYNLKVFSRFHKKNSFFLKKLSDLALFNPDTIFFCNPCTKRLKFLNLIKKTKNIFFEKPLSSNFNDGQKIFTLTKNKKNILVGYNLRFLNILNFVKKNLTKYVGKVYSFNCECGYYLPNWRKKNYLNSVSAQKKLGGGALLEMSHELDYIHWIFGDKYKSKIFYLNTKNLKIDVEDNVKIIFNFKNKVLGSLSLDFLCYKKKRFLTINGSKGTLKVNLINNNLKLFTKKSKNWEKIAFKRNSINNTYKELVKYFFYKKSHYLKKNISTIQDSIIILRNIKDMHKQNK